MNAKGKLWSLLSRYEGMSTSQAQNMPSRAPKNYEKMIIRKNTKFSPSFLLAVYTPMLTAGLKWAPVI